jgi:16S rRNA (guanine527-N7)-methyltransferase
MFQELLTTEFSPYGQLSGEQLARLQAHYDLLLSWNRTLNLTRIEDVADAVRFHYCESLFLGGRLPKRPLVVADVGSGAGFPGIPVAILRPDLKLILIESHQRKAVFLREAIRGLPNLEVEPVRAEVWKGRADWAISRAVAPAEVLRANVAGNWGLLVAAKDAPAGSELIRSPWGADRVVAFHVEQESRGST